MADQYNQARYCRMGEIMDDFRNLQNYLAQLRVTPAQEDYYLEGHSQLRACIADGHAALQAPSPIVGQDGALDPERERQQLRVIITDAAVRRFQCQRAYLRSLSCRRWVDSRNIILQGQRPNASHMGLLQQIDITLRNELLAITDVYVESTLRAQDAAQGKWLAEDPSLAQIQQILLSRR